MIWDRNGGHLMQEAGGEGWRTLLLPCILENSQINEVFLRDLPTSPSPLLSSFES